MRSLSNKARLLAAGAAAAFGLAMQPASAQVSISDANAGSAVVVPYYTVNEGWRTLLEISNTSGNTLAVKFRLHEKRNSRDILDFNLVLSPYDVWTGFIRRDPQGRAFISTDDRSCTSPLQVRDQGLVSNELAYSDFSSSALGGGNVNGTYRDHDATNGDIGRTAEGYIVLIVMGEEERNDGVGAADPTFPNIDDGPRGATAWYAKHVNGEPRSCTQVDRDFVARATASAGGNNVGPGQIPVDFLDGTNPIPGEDGSGDPDARRTASNDFGFGPVLTGDSLKVNAIIRKEDAGIAAGINPLHIRNWGVADDPANAVNLVTAQNFPYFLEPTLASIDGLWTMTGLAAVEGGISSTAINNTWTNNSAQGVNATAEWIVNMPTKRFHVDEDADNIQAACNTYRNMGVTTSGTPFGAAAGPHAGSWDTSEFAPPQILRDGSTPLCTLAPFNQPFQAGNNGVSPVALEFDIYDREERVATLQQDVGTTPSPAPPAPVQEQQALNFETNIIRIARDAATVPSTLNSADTVPVDVNDSGLGGNQQAGMAQLNFIDAATSGIPVVGGLVRVQDFGDPTVNNGSFSDHKFVRPTP